MGHPDEDKREAPQAATDEAPTITRSSAPLSMPVGPNGETEEFEWRSSRGDDIKELAQGSSWGYKLVRLQGPNTKPGGSSTAAQSSGFTSDGKEAVALIALNATWSWTKAIRFAFMGSGLSGTMGEAWEIATLTSALQLYYVYVVASAASAGAA